MPDDSKPDAGRGKLMLWLVGGACAACCAFPVLGIAAGSVMSAGLAIFSGWAALVGAAIVAGVFFFRMGRKRDQVCKCDGPCQPKALTHQSSVKDH